MDPGENLRTIVLDIVPKPAARPRFFRGRVHSEPKYKAWQQECTALLRLQWDEPRPQGGVGDVNLSSLSKLSCLVSLVAC